VIEKFGKEQTLTEKLGKNKNVNEDDKWDRADNFVFLATKDGKPRRKVITSRALSSESFRSTRSKKSLKKSVKR
jgi:hypothetical protein